MAAPYRSSCTIDGQKFDCLSISVAFSTDKDRSGMPQMGSLQLPSAPMSTSMTTSTCRTPP